MSSSDSCSPPSAAVVAPLAAVQWPSDSANTVLIIQHSDYVPPAYVVTFLESQNQPYHILHIDYLGATFPPTSVTWKAIVSLGGPQGSYEEDLHSFIKLEKAFLKAHIDANAVVLGICLGCQMMADAIGGKAYKASHLEAGYPKVTLTEAGKCDPLTKALFSKLNEGEEGTVCNNFLMHHGDTFDLPSGVQLLAQTEFKQAYRYKNALAVQFHPEASVIELAMWAAWNPARYLEVGTSAEKLVQAAVEKKETATKASQAFFEAWWTTAGFKLKEVAEQKQ